MAYLRCTGTPGGSLKLRTAQGEIASFETNIVDLLQEVKCGINATGGNGTPDSPIPINGYTEANITRCGVNLFDVSNINDTHGSNTLSISGNEITMTWVNGATILNTKNKQIFKAGTYVIKGFGTNTNKVRCFFYKASDNTSLGNVFLNAGTPKTLSYPFYIEIGGQYDEPDTAVFTLQLELGNTASDFTPYTGNTYTIAFGQKVYGGVLDVTNGKVKPCIEYPSYNGETLSGRWLSSEATYIEGTTPPIGSQVVSLDDYGSNIDLTPEVISAVVGTNNVFADCGETEVKYLYLE